MDGATIQSKVYRGYAKTAAKLGLSFNQFRPATATNPVSGTPLATLPAAFDVNGKFDAPREYAKATWRIYADFSQTLPGDYLVEVAPTQTGQAPRTFFVASQQPLLPPSAVLCNAVVSLQRADGDSGTEGAQAEYDTVSQETYTQLAIGWPASMLAGTKGEKNVEDLPDSTRDAWYIVLLPPIPGVVIQVDDVLTDALGRICKISSCELSALGWRLSVQSTMA
jgi:hypothetical protein